MESFSPPYLRVCKDATDLVQKAETWLKDEIQRTGATSVFIPAGNTPLPLYARWEKAYPEYLRGIQLCGVDDVISGPGAGMFQSFFELKLPSFQSQFSAVQENLRSIPRVALLGVGMNGHVAFHEPHVPSNWVKGEVRLSAQTCEELGLTEPVQGLTYGIGAFSQCQSVAILVSGEKKRFILERILRNDLSLPVCQLIQELLKKEKDGAQVLIFAEEKTILSRQVKGEVS